MRAFTKMMQNGKTKAHSGDGHKSVTIRPRTHIKKLASGDLNHKIWHNWLTEENPFFQVTPPTAEGAPLPSNISELESGELTAMSKK